MRQNPCVQVYKRRCRQILRGSKLLESLMKQSSDVLAHDIKTALNYSLLSEVINISL